MFIGHYAVGLALRRAAPRTSLGWLIAASQFADLLWPILLLAGVERARIDPGNTVVTPLAFDSYPVSHSLVMMCVWGLILGGVYFWRTGLGRAATWIGIAVVSHWVLDFLTHRPDMPLAPWSPVKVGLGLWSSMPATVIVESALYAIGAWLYLSGTRARDGIGRWSCWAFIALLAVIYVANLISPPPPAMNVVAVSALVLWLFPFWAAWFDRHRTVTPSPDVTVERT